MDNDVVSLKKEISILKERVSILESKEKKRTVYKYIKTLFTILIVFSIALGLWKAYDYVTNYIPGYFDDAIKDGIDKLTNN